MTKPPPNKKNVGRGRKKGKSQKKSHFGNIVDDFYPVNEEEEKFEDYFIPKAPKSDDIPKHSISNQPLPKRTLYS